MLQNDVIKCCKMMSSNVALLHSNNCCVLEPAIYEDLDLHVVIFLLVIHSKIDKIAILKYLRICISSLKLAAIYNASNLCFGMIISGNVQCKDGITAPSDNAIASSIAACI